MKKINFLIAMTILLGFTSCSTDDEPELLPLKASKVENFYAPSARANPNATFKYFSFATGGEVTESESWDVAFKGTKIITNSGVSGSGNAAATVVTGTLASVKEVNVGDLNIDTESLLAVPYGSGKGWYNYDRTTHLISPIAGKIIVVKTDGGHYAKMEILSYYKDNDTSAGSGYYTFNYVYQPNDGVNTFE